MLTPFAISYLANQSVISRVIIGTSEARKRLTTLKREHATLRQAATTLRSESAKEFEELSLQFRKGIQAHHASFQKTAVTLLARAEEDATHAAQAAAREIQQLKEGEEKREIDAVALQSSTSAITAALRAELSKLGADAQLMRTEIASQGERLGREMLASADLKAHHWAEMQALRVQVGIFCMLVIIFTS